MTTPRRPPSRAGAARRGVVAIDTRGPASGLILALPLAWLGVVYLGSLAVLFLNAFWQTRPVHVARRPRIHARQLRRAVHDRGLSNGHRPDRRDGGAGHRDLHRPGLPDRLLHGQGGVTAHARAPRGRGRDAALGELPHQGLLVAARSCPRTGCWTGCSSRSACEVPGFGDIAIWLAFTYLWLPYMILPDLRRAWSGSRARCWRRPPTSAGAAG